MSKVVIRTHYSVGGKSVGGGFTNYIARRDRVDKTINARRSEVFPKYAADVPASRKERTAWHLDGHRNPSGELIITCLEMSVSEVKAKAKELGDDVVDQLIEKYCK